MAKLSDRGFLASRGLSFTLEDTAQNVDTALAGNITHNLGALPSALELWVEQSAGVWEKHDPATYVLATSTELQDTGTTLESVVGASTNVRLVAAAGAVAVSVQEAASGVAGIIGAGGSQTLTPNLTLENGLTVSGKISTDASHLGGYGLLPVGAIVAYNPGYYTNGSNSSFTVVGPAGNTVAQVNSFLNAKGWYVCDGAALNVAASPIWNAASRHLPNLDDSRFLMGSTSAGTQGGTNAINLQHTHSVTSNVTVGNHTLTTANLPPHTHGVGTYATNVSLTNNTGISKDTHVHVMQTGTLSPDRRLVVQAVTSGGVNKNVQTNVAPSSDLNSITAAPGGGSTIGITNGSMTGSSGSVGSGTAVTHSVTNNAVTSGNALSSSQSILPQYLSTYFIVRAF